MRISDWSSDVCSSDLDPYVPALQVFDGSRKVVDIQREMRGAIIAVFGLFLALVRSIEFEEFKIGSIPAPDPLGYRCGGRMQVDIVLHPCPFEWPDLIGEEAFAPQHVDEEVNGLFQIGHRQRSEERRVGQECVRTCRSRWVPYPYKKKE